MSAKYRELHYAYICYNFSDVYRGGGGTTSVVQMEVLPLPVPSPLGVGDPRDPRDRQCLHAHLRALLERQREEEERMFSRLRLDGGPLGESTEKEVQTWQFTSMPLPTSTK